MPLRYRFRLRDLGDTADLIYATSVRDGLHPFVESPPQADGQEMDPVTGHMTQGATTIRVIDWWGQFCIDPDLLS
jgi:hypothetical protein